MFRKKIFINILLISGFIIFALSVNTSSFASSNLRASTNSTSNADSSNTSVSSIGSSSNSTSSLGISNSVTSASDIETESNSLQASSADTSNSVAAISADASTTAPSTTAKTNSTTIQSVSQIDNSYSSFSDINIILNILLIAIGFVLILLSIAILIRIKQ